MARFNSKLDQVRVAAPCNVDWDTMFGNERVRFCGRCQLNVYNLSEMSKLEAEQLIGRSEGRLCVRYYQRNDGSILTQNCPVGLRAVKRRVSLVARAIVSALVTFFAGIGVHYLASRLALVQTQVTGRLVVGDLYMPREMMGTIAVNPVSPPPPSRPVVVGELIPIQRIKRTQRHHR